MKAKILKVRGGMAALDGEGLGRAEKGAVFQAETITGVVLAEVKIVQPGDIPLGKVKHADFVSEESLVGMELELG